jgi:hypothetical protein
MKSKLAVATLVALLVPIAAAQAQWVFLARHAAQRIHHMREGAVGGQPGYDFATVILEAPAARVFEVALEHAKANRALRILMVNPTERRLQVAEGDRTATLNVIELNEQVSELVIAGTERPGEDPTASRVVQAVMRVCMELKKSCSLSR